MTGTFPNSILPHLNEIADRLWSGHAAVMVGAGFSKNATPLDECCKGFPDWNKLGESFYEKTRGEDICDGRFLNVLKLADEVQASFGRPMLHQLLRDLIPDDEYEPSIIHRELLKLPWSDVLTTNYDTLLERASRAITDRNYQLVVNSQSIIYSKQPRIIKLHGSFPNEEPFIITEEDYRRYPVDFAPFVNTVQQSLLENTLCLIGFSGDDPNFLRWIGWIRDNLGEENSPKIYLIGVLNLTKAQTSLLSKYNIVPIDMSEMEEIGSNDHYAGIEKFFEFCKSKESNSGSLDWPKKDSQIYFDKYNSSKSTEEQIKQIIPEWKHQRDNFPDWVIVPDDQRYRLWSQTYSWEGSISSTEEVSPLVLLEFLYEYLWRLEKCLCPIWDPNVELIEFILDLGAKHVNDKASPSAEVIDDLFSLPLNKIKEKCCFIQLSYLRYLREEGKIDSWKKNKDRASLFVSQPNEHARYHYETCLFSLFEFNSGELEAALKEWKLAENQPFWIAKKAGLLAEVGYLEESSRLLSGALRTVRARLNLKPITTSYAEVSQESYILVLLRYVHNALSFSRNNFGEHEEQAEYSERWDALKQYKCDPWNELKLLESFLTKEFKKATNSNHNELFDLHRNQQEVITFKQNKDALEAFKFLKFLEDTGIPIRLSNSTFAKEAAYGAIERLSDTAPYWCMTTMLRIGESKAVDKIFNRRSLYGMAQDEVNSLVLNYVRMFKDAVLSTEYKQSARTNLLKRIVPETLSRLLTKASQAELLHIFSILENIAKSDETSTYEAIDKLARRFVESLSEDNLLDFLPAFLDFPVVDSNDFIASRELPNLFDFLGHIQPELLRIPKDFKLDEKRIQTLIDYVESGSDGKRKSCTHTLYELNRLGLLNTTQVGLFKQGLESRLDDSGFPQATHFYRFAIVREFYSDSEEHKDKLKKYILNSEVVTQNDKTEGITLSGGRVNLCYEIAGASHFIQWTNEEAYEIASKLVRWWHREKSLLDSHRNERVQDEINSRFIKINLVFREISSYLSLESDDNLKPILEMVEEMEDKGLPVFSIKAALSHDVKNWHASLLDSFSESYVDTKKNFIIDAVEGLYCLLGRDNESETVDNCLNIVQNTLLLRDSKRLLQSLFIAHTIVNNHSQRFTGSFEKATMFALDKVRDETLNLEHVSDFNEQLVLRENAARLAFTIYNFYERTDVKVPKSLKLWKAVCKRPEEFVEIRNSWPVNKGKRN
ncbi:SIR2 family protein [Vibrio europaeus]|uniref:SIR2 family NAD-dependent protein deacylase n=1 Tax=Vibrio europaeus TaxID=300876 RepID=UPI00234186C4|nr:SIR2 family protein [Vibrio europaeus]MDC5842187.1 SIR2 family protein [Vibrio europaeus]